MITSKGPDYSTYTKDSKGDSERIDLGELPTPSPEVGELLDRLRDSDRMTLPEWGRWQKQFQWTKEQLDAIPLHVGIPRFTLD